MKKCCTNCRLRLDLEKLDYSQTGCQHTKLDGFCCLAFAFEGQADWMVGINPDEGMCECFVAKAMTIEEALDAYVSGNHYY